MPTVSELLPKGGSITITNNDPSVAFRNNILSGYRGYRKLDMIILLMPWDLVDSREKYEIYYSLVSAAYFGGDKPLGVQSEDADGISSSDIHKYIAERMSNEDKERRNAIQKKTLWQRIKSIFN